MHMLIRYFLVSFLFFIGLIQAATLSAQMVVGQDTLYGNEWIDYNKTYWKIKVAERDMYRVTFDVLQAGGFPVDQVPGDQFQLFVFGEEVPLYVSTDGLLGTSDYFEFYGDKNKSQLDQFLYEGGREAMLNPEVSLYTDTAVYFLTTTSQNALRYKTIDPPAIPIIPPLHTYIDSSRLDFISWHYSKTYDSDQLVRYSIYDEHEGFASPSLKKSIYNQATPDIILDSAGLIQIKLISSSAPHHLQITINNNLVFDSLNYPSNQVEQLDIHLPAGILEQINTIQIEGLESNSDRFQIASSTIQYHRTLPFNNTGSMFIHAEPSNSGTLYSWKSSDPYTLFNHTLHTRTELSASNDSIRFALNPSPIETRLSLCNIFANPNAILSIQSMNFIDYSALPGNYIIISHPKLLKSSTGENPLEAYKNYRESADGGNFQVQIMMIDQLIDQYAWGNSHHPLAVRNWVAEAESLNLPIRYLFILAKGLEYPYVRIPSIDFSENNLISPFGFLGSDNLLASTPENSTPLFSISRVSAATGNDVLNYLNKVKQYESSINLPRSISNHSWKRQALHLVGGQNTSELENHKSLLLGLAETLQTHHIGINVNTLTGNSTDPVSSSSIQYVINEINRGLLIKTYLGHGGVTTTGNFSIDDAAVLNNDHYPVIFSLGCLTGNTFTPEYSLSEMFTLIPEKGSIAYIASSGYGFSSSLSDFTKEFYNLLGTNNWNLGLGDIMKSVRAKFEPFTGISHRSLIDQFNLHADPAIRLFPDSLPDFTLEPKHILFNPTVSEVTADSIHMEWVIWNLGRATESFLPYKIEHTFPDGRSMVYLDSIQFYSPNITLHTNIKDGLNIAGEHRIAIKLDPNNLIPEIINGGESNNDVQLSGGENYVTFQVVDRRPSLLTPLNFSIHHPDNISLQCFSTQNESETLHATFVLDTVPHLSSPYRLTWETEMTGALAQIDIPFPLLPDKIYYWTASFQSHDGLVIGADTIYSFLTDLVHSGGWNQSSSFQYNQNQRFDLRIDSTTNQFSFDSIYINANARAAILSVSNNVATRVFVNDIRIINSVNDASINVGVINPVNGSVTTTKSFKLNGSDNQRQAGVAFLRDEVQDSSYVIVATFRKPQSSYLLENWNNDSILLGDHYYSVLEKEGATLIRGMDSLGSVPYAFAYQKSVGPIAESIADTSEQNAYILFDLAFPRDSGSMITPVIGPSNGWNELTWKADLQALNSTDSFYIQLFGLPHPDSTGVLLIAQANTTEDLFQIDHSTYPYLQLSYTSTSPNVRTPLQLVHWRITYEGVPDLIPSTYYIQEDSILLGKMIEVPVTLYNVGEKMLDSFDVQIIHQQPDLSKTIQIVHLNSLAKQDSVLLTFKQILSQVGQHRFQIQVDPENHIVESSDANNSASITFHVIPDLEVPFLQVTFDGNQLPENAIVRSNPLIEIKLYDSHPFLRLTDTSTIQIKLYDPLNKALNLSYTKGNIVFNPAPPSGINLATSILQPELNLEGTYRLEVTAQDISKNPTPALQKTIHFQITHDSHLDAFHVYPNPGSGNIYMCYSLTGPSTPSHAEFILYDATGKIVAQYSEADFGTLQIGTHILNLQLQNRSGAESLPGGSYFYDFKIWDQAGNRIPIKLKEGELPGKLILLDTK